MAVPSRSRTLLVALALPLVGGAAAAQSQPSGPRPLTDPQIAHVAVTANGIDVSMARLAESRAKDAGVRRFAATMIRDHTAVNEQAAALAKKLGVVPADNAVSQSLEGGAAQARAKLSKLRGAAFDRAYMRREVGYHAAVLDALDKTLIPDTQNGELKSLLESARAAIAAHLEMAKAIQARLGG